jgi:FixJ family two-component response regulator
MKGQHQISVSGPLVIVVDDDPAVRNSLKFALEIEGFSVRDFASAAEFLEAGEMPGCGCLVIDEKLPGMTGLDLIAKLRERHNSVPAILITSNPSALLTARAARANTPIVEKPLLGNALMDKIRAVCAPANGRSAS